MRARDYKSVDIHFLRSKDEISYRLTDLGVRLYEILEPKIIYECLSRLITQIPLAFAKTNERALARNRINRSQLFGKLGTAELRSWCAECVL